MAATFDPVALDRPGHPPLVLRPAGLTDAPAFAAHVAADLGHLARHLPWPAATTTDDGARDFIGAYVRRADDRELLLLLEDRGTLLGGTVLLRHDPGVGSVEVGCWIVASAEGQGLVRRSVLATIAHARAALGSHRVVWTAAAGNERSRALAERIGFVHEGRLRAAGLHDGQYQDLDVLSLVGDEVDAALR